MRERDELRFAYRWSNLDDAVLLAADFELENDKIEAIERNDQDLLAFDMADEALEAAAEKSKPAFTLIGSPTVSVLVACCG